ncbi:MAG TPA: type II secretion system protein [Gemmatimonadaceae bacterium]|nr:type II secretion system protein [Gemmatimonadaceae bacterium]
MSSTLRPRVAFTLVELTIVLGVVGILLLVALPRVGAALDRIRARSAASDAAVFLAGARHTAIRRGRHAWVEMRERDASLRLIVQGDTVAVRALGEVYGVALDASRPVIAYGPTGLGWGAANVRITVRRGTAAESVFTSRLGRIRQ